MKVIVTVTVTVMLR